MAEAEELTAEPYTPCGDADLPPVPLVVPERWRTTSLDAVAHIRLGRTPARDNRKYWEDGKVPWVAIGDLNDGLVRQTKERISEAAHRDVFKDEVVEPGTLLLSFKLTIGKVGILAISAVHNEAIASLRLTSPDIDRDFLFYVLQSLNYDVYLDTYVKGRTLNKDKLRSLQIPLPPLPEQRAIARALRAVQEAIHARRREVELERERKAALMQRLFTHGTRGEPTKHTRFGSVPQSWRIVPLEECAHVQTGVAKGRNLDGRHVVSVPYLRVANVQDGYLDLSEIKLIDLADDEVARYLLRPGDVLLTEGGDFDKLGRGFIWHGQVPTCVHQNHIFAVRAQQDVLRNEFLAYLIQSPYGKAYFLSVAHRTTNLASINSTKLKALPALLPSLPDQDEIVQLLDACDVQIAAQELDLSLHQELFTVLLEELMTGRVSALPVLENDADGLSLANTYMKAE